MQLEYHKYGTIFRYPEPQLSEINNLAYSPPPILPKYPTLVLKMG